MQPALSTVCTLASPLENDLAHYAAGQCDAVELWLTKVETYLQKNSADDFLELLAEHKIAAPVAAYQGGLLDSQGDRRAETWRHFRKRLELCSQLGVGLLVVAADVAPPLEQEDLDRVRVSLRQAAEAAQDCGVRLALEPQAGSAICNNLQTALAMVEETASPALGICLDAFHFAVGPSKTEDLALLSCENLAHVQLCDLAGVPRELATDADRILPGDGDLPLEPIVRRLREIDYQGCVSVELLNPQIFQVPPRQFGEIAITALRKVLGLAKMAEEE